MSDNQHISLDVGQTVVARSDAQYQVIQWLGKGGNATTFLVLCSRGQNKGSFFALKLFFNISEQTRLQNFLSEISFLNDCNHPAIMRVYDEGAYNGSASNSPFVVSEYLPTTLGQLDYGSLNICDKLSITIQLLSGLAYLESLTPPVTHRDLKPANMFIKGRSCIIGDFGLMKRIGSLDETDREVFKQSLGPGMPYKYRTPDLVDYANNRSPLTQKTDVFQMGLVIAELFTRTNLCKPTDNLLSNVELLTLPFIRGHLGGRIASIIRQMLVFNPTERPAAIELLPRWESIFMETVYASHVLHGHVFEPFTKMNYIIKI